MKTAKKPAMQASDRLNTEIALSELGLAPELLALLSGSEAEPEIIRESRQEPPSVTSFLEHLALGFRGLEQHVKEQEAANRLQTSYMDVLNSHIENIGEQIHAITSQVQDLRKQTDPAIKIEAVKTILERGIAAAVARATEPLTNQVSELLRRIQALENRPTGQSSPSGYSTIHAFLMRSAGVKKIEVGKLDVIKAKLRTRALALCETRGVKPQKDYSVPAFPKGIYAFPEHILSEAWIAMHAK